MDPLSPPRGVGPNAQPASTATKPKGVRIKKVTDAITKRCRRAINLVRVGAFRLAINALSSGATADPANPTHLAAIKKLFPDGPKVLPRCPDDAVFVEVTADDVKQMIKRLGKGKGTGPSGWCRELLYPLVGSERCMQLLAKVIQVIANDQMSDELNSWLLKNYLIPLLKNGVDIDGGIRPILPEDCLIKLASQIAREKCKTRISEGLCPDQKGLEGTEVALSRIIELWTETSISIIDRVVITVDVVNAYNSIGT